MLLNQMETCLIRPIVPSGFWGGVFTGVGVLQGLPKEHAPKIFARNFAFIYSYHVLKCPMEAISQRRSLLHNAIALGIMGYVGVMKQMVGIPFVDAHVLSYVRAVHPRMTPPIMGALVYGGIGGFLGALEGKPL